MDTASEYINKLCLGICWFGAENHSLHSLEGILGRDLEHYLYCNSCWCMAHGCVGAQSTGYIVIYDYRHENVLPIKLNIYLRDLEFLDM